MKIVNSLQTVPSPFLPVAPRQYEAQYHDQVNNVLRLFFNNSYGSLVSLIGPLGGQYLNTPHLSAYDTSNQYDGSTSIPYAVRFSTPALENGISIEARSFSGICDISSTTMTCSVVTSGRLFPSMLLSGTGVTDGTYVYLQLSSTATPIVGTQAYVSGGGVGTTSFVVSGGAGNIEARQFVSGTGVPANTRVISAVYDNNTQNTTVTLNAAFTVQASGNYVFRPWGYAGTYSVSPSQTVSSTNVLGNLQSLIRVAQPGIYNVQFSLQFTNTDLNKDHEVDVWFRKNDVDMADSNSQFSIPGAHSGHNGQLIAALNMFVELRADDDLEIVWHTSDSTVYIETIAAASNPIRPRTPSAIVTVSFVSTLTEA